MSVVNWASVPAVESYPGISRQQHCILKVLADRRSLSGIAAVLALVHGDLTAQDLQIVHQCRLLGLRTRGGELWQHSSSQNPQNGDDDQHFDQREALTMLTLHGIFSALEERNWLP